MSRKLTGCCNCMIATQKNDGGKITFNKPEAIVDLEAFNYAYNYAEGSNYADNKQNIYKKKKTSVNVDLDFSAISLKIKALLQGKKYSKGGASSNPNDQSAPVAVLFQKNYDDGSYENVVFYNVKLYEKDNSNATEGESINYTSQGFSGVGLSFTNDDINGDFEFIMDSADPDVDKEKLDSFFTEVKFYEEAKIDVAYADYTSGEVTEISVKGASFDKQGKKFKGIPESTTTFTFKLDQTQKTATKGKDAWTFK